MKIITGMHRSGTSMTSNLLLEIAGQNNHESKENLIQSDIWNKKGYFENKYIVAINNSIILGPHAPSSKIIRNPDLKNNRVLHIISCFFNLNYLFVLLFPKILFKNAKKYYPAIENLSKEFSNQIVKDPRFSLLVEHWVKYGSIKKILVCFRDPYEVAMSLKKRNNLPLSIGYWLWHFHNKELLDSIKRINGKKVIFIHYNNFFDDEKQHLEIKKLFNFLEIEYDIDIANRIANNIIDENLKHQYNHKKNYPKKIEKKYHELIQHHKNCESSI